MHSLPTLGVENERSVADPVAGSLRRGGAWLVGLIGADGGIAGSALASVYYKVPATLALNGELGAARRNLEFIAAHFLTSDGGLSIPADQPAARSYDRGWLVWGAAMCGRYDIAFRLADELKASQNPATGGFWDTPQEQAAGSGRQNALSVGMAGLGLLSVRHVDGARRAADFLLHLLRIQPASEEGMYLAMDVSAAGQPTLVASRTPLDYVDRRGVKQRPARLGPAQVLLIRLYRLSKESRYLDAAWAYTTLFLEGAPGIYDCVEAHKFMWGLDELDGVSPDARLREASDRIAGYLVARQQPDGQWWGDAVGGGDGQSLDLRLNTTCNALVGLASHLHART
jgi:hypothetical protein